MRRLERQLQAREATRRAILDAARELFVADGYAQVSMRNIATRVEYSPAAIYSYFPSKDDIFFALAEEGLRLLEATHPAPPTGDPLEDLRVCAWRLHLFSKEQPQYFALVFLDRHVPRIGREYHERFDHVTKMKALVRSRVDRCIEDGLFPPTIHPDVALRLLFAPVFGIAGLRLSGRLAPGEDADALVRDAIATTIAGLRAGAPVHARPPAPCALDAEPAQTAQLS